MKILVIGQGYVGSSAKRMFERRYDVETVDPKAEATYKEIPDKRYDLAVVAVPTDPKNTGQCDFSIVKDVVGEVKAKVILIKSTVQIGTTKWLKEFYGKRIVMSPEYIGQGGYHSTYDFHQEMYKTPWWVLGGDEKDCDYVKEIILPIVGPQKKWFYVTETEAEVVKYMENMYFALKVTFANEMFEICDAFDCNFEKVRQAWGADPRVDIMHTACFANDRGFGGHCLPKDANALIFASKKQGYNPELLQQVLRSNEKFTEGKIKKKVTD